MKLLTIGSNKLNIEFYLDELSLLRNAIGIPFYDFVIGGPVYAFAIKNFKKKIGADRSYVDNLWERLNELVESEPEFVRLSMLPYIPPETKNFKKTLELNFKDFLILKKAFDVAVKVTGKNEMHILTGYEWEEALALQKSFKDILDMAGIPI